MYNNEHIHVISSPQSSASGGTYQSEGSAQQHPTAARFIVESDHEGPETEGKKTGKRSGFQNCSERDVEILLDIVEQRRPIGTYDWAVVAKDFNDHAEEFGSIMQDLELLRMRYDHLANMKKRKESASCPEAVRRAKCIARIVLQKVKAVSVSD